MSNSYSTSAGETGAQQQPMQVVYGPAAPEFFSLFLIFVWLLQYTSSDQEILLPDRLAYALFVIPAVGLTAVGMFLALTRAASFRRDVWVLLLFLAVISAIAVARLDAPTILSVGLLCGVLIAILQNRLSVSPTFINILFLLSIPVAEVMFRLGLSQYTVIPDFEDLQGLGWRVAVFPHVASSGFFALIVLFMNITIREAKFRWPCLFLAGYFLLFSGIRTAIISGILAGIYLILSGFGLMKSTLWRRTFFGASALLFVFTIFSSAFITQMPILDNPFLRSLVIRDDQVGYNVGDQVFTAAVRSWIINEHLELFLSHPLFGYGTFDLRALQSGYGAFDQLSTSGSEAFLTGLFARIGLPALIFLYAIFGMRRPLPADQVELSRCLKLFLFLAMIAYGSFVTPYDFIFILMIIAIASGYAVPVASASLVRGSETASPPRPLPVP